MTDVEDVPEKMRDPETINLTATHSGFILIAWWDAQNERINGVMRFGSGRHQNLVGIPDEKLVERIQDPEMLKAELITEDGPIEVMNRGL